MIKPRDIEMEIEEADAHRVAGRLDLARAKYTLALNLAGQTMRSAHWFGRIGGPLAGASVAELIDGLSGGIDHPLFDLIVGGLAGAALGRKGAELYEGSLSPLMVRIYNGLGDVARDVGDDVEARRCYSTALKMAPDDPVTMQRMAEVT